jgi:NAD(P)-dependent dehydrogenase (short-subunit alcohol dehydrogenase family)
MAVAIVTGGASGIGAACVAMLRDEGVRVGAIDLGEAPGADASAQADVSDHGALGAAFAALEAELGPCDHLVTCAGRYWERPIDALTPDDWSGMLRLHVGGTAAAMRLALPGMLERRRGSIVAIGSELGLIGDPNAPHYAAAKGAIHALVKSLAPEIAATGVRVNVVAPGPTDTPLLRDDPEFPHYGATLPLGRVIQPDEIAAAVRFALLEDTTLTGQVVSPNGGAVL